MVTVAEIAKQAFDAVALAVTDAIIDFDLSEDVKSVTYDTATSSFPIVPTSRGSSRGVVDTVKPINDVFPDYIVGPSDILIFLEGYTTPPVEGWIITGQGIPRTVKRVQDTLLAGSVGFVVAV